MPTLTIPRDERGKIRVFALSMSDAEASVLDPKANPAHPTADDAAPTAPQPLARLLGTERIDPEYIEVFPVADLADLGLAGYLLEGEGADPTGVERDRTRLSALDGWVMLVYSGAFKGEARTLSPVADLTLIGTYDELRPDHTSAPIPSEAAKPYTGTPTQIPAIPPKGRAGGSMIVLGLIVVVGLLLWWALT